MTAVASETRKICWAVAGAGEFGRNHVRIYREMPGADLIGVYDSDAARGAALAQEYQTNAFGNLEELRGKVDAASVAVPTIAHAEVGCRLMEMGIDVLVEKPIAPTLGEAERRRGPTRGL